ncbi:MAG: hypothetical protein Q9166_001399 [cf. Caloplaca sp. 2 TL-2023]
MPRESRDDSSGPSFQARLRNLAFSRSGSSSPGKIASQNTFNRDEDSEFRLKYISDLSKDRPLKDRIGSLLTAAKDININKCSSDTVLAILSAAEDLFEENADSETRKAGFSFFTIAGPVLDLDRRAKVYEYIIKSAHPSCLAGQVSAIDALTDHGTKASTFQPHVTDFVSELLSNCFLAADRSRSDRRSKSSPSDEESNLVTVMSLLDHLVAHDWRGIDESRTKQLMYRLTAVCKRTTVESDLSSALAIINTVAAQAKVPNDNLDLLINLLCHMSYARENLRSDAQHCLDNILIGSDRSLAMEVLLRNLSQISDEPASIKELRGSLLQLEHIYEANVVEASKGPPIAELVQALKDAATVDHGDLIQNRVTLTLSLKVIASMITNDSIIETSMDDDWTCMDGIVKMIADVAGSIPPDDPTYNDITPASPIYRFAHGMEIRSSDVTEEMNLAVRSICRGLSRLYPRLSLEKQTLVVNVLLFLGNIAEPDALSVVIDYMEHRRLVYPPNEDWLVHISILTERGFFDSSKQSRYRAQVLNLVSDVYNSVSGESGIADEFGQHFAKLMTRAVSGSNVALINQLATLANRILLNAGMPIFNSLLAVLVDLAIYESSSELTLPALSVPEDRINTTSIRLIESFVEFLPCQAPKAQKICDSLVAIANNPGAPSEVRLNCIQLFTRLRCDSDGVLYVIEIPDTQGLAAALSNTQPAHGPSNGSAHSNRASLTEDCSQFRSSRNSGINNTSGDDARSKPQSTIMEVYAERLHPIWTYSGPPDGPTNPLRVLATADTGYTSFDPSSWLDLVLDTLGKGSDWEIYSHVLLHLPSQLTNVSLFVNILPRIERLHDLIVYQLQKGKFFEPPTSSGRKKGDVALFLYQSLTVIIGYGGWFLPQKMTETVHTFLIGISQWSQTPKCCIHALALCCHELPRAVDRCLSLILTKMSQIITQSQFAIDILEFLTRLARLPAAYQSIGEEPLRTIFGICIRHLHHSRETRQIADDSTRLGSSKRISNVSGNVSLSSDSSQAVGTDKDLPEYVYTLAYHVITHWFLAIPIKDRSKHVGWIAKNLAWKDKSGEEIVEEQSQVTLDMMHRTAYLDLGETMRPSICTDDESHMIKKMYLVGMSIISMETNVTTGLTHITKRQASGTTNATYQPCTAPLPAHHVEVQNLATSASTNALTLVYPQHVLLQLSSTISPMPIPTQPIVLPDDGSPERAIRQIDGIATVDSYKAGVIYVGYGQTEEKEILANAAGSEAFDAFLAGLGTKVVLQGANFNTSGLDKASNMDGTHTYAWRDRVTEVVFHIPTMMPNLEHDPQCTNKKKHTGNDYANIIFNESGLPFRFDTFPSALNFVNIVITPEKVLTPQSPLLPADNVGSDGYETCYFFKVQVLCAPFLPEMSPAATPKIVTAAALPSYVRQLALNAHLFSLVWSERAQGDELVSSWRSRLREIRKLRDKYANTGTSANVGYPEMGTAEDRGGAKSYVEGDEWKGTLAMGGLAEQGQFLMSLDFTRWT